MEGVKKPIAKVVGADSNIFTTLGICTTALNKAGLRKEAKELTDKVFEAESYSKALAIMSEYCELR